MSKSVGMKSSLLFFVFSLWFSVMPIVSFAAWTTEAVDRSGDVGEYTSIATDSNNGVHISYYDATNGDLKYTTNASGSWVTETVDSGYVGWLFTSIAVDSNNKAHISYLDPFNGILKYATNTSGSWVTETVDNAQPQMEPSSEYTSIAVDLNNHVHISYYGDLGGLKHAIKVSGSWIKETIDSGIYVGMATSIAIDSLNMVHISYCGTNGDLKYATGYFGPWVIQTVDRAVCVLLQLSSVENTSITTDSNNNVHISYYDGSNDDLKYATNAPGSWVIQTVDSAGDVGGYTSMAVDSNNNVHISYYDATNGYLRYATNASGSWVIQTVDSAGDVGISTSIAIANNKVHISYYDATNGDLKYATSDMDVTAPSTTASPAGGTYSSAQSVTLTCNDGPGSGCQTTYYCLGSGCNPTTVYSGPINISSSTTLRFYSTDSANNSESVKTETYTINTGCSAVTVISPNNGEVIPSGSTYTINWCAPPQAVKFDLFYSLNKGTTWKPIATKITGTSYNWTVPVPTNNKKNCLVKIIGYDIFGIKTGEDTSDTTFTVEVIKVTSPNGGEAVQGYSTWWITWRTNATVNPVAKEDLYYTNDGGVSWKLITSRTGNLGSYPWRVPLVGALKPKCKVKVVLKDASGKNVGSDVSDKFFAIKP